MVSKDVAAEIRFAVFEVHQPEQAEYLACNFSVFRFLSLRRTKSYRKRFPLLFPPLQIFLMLDVIEKKGRACFFLFSVNMSVPVCLSGTGFLIQGISQQFCVSWLSSEYLYFWLLTIGIFRRFKFYYSWFCALLCSFCRSETCMVREVWSEVSLKWSDWGSVCGVNVFISVVLNRNEAESKLNPGKQ